ncbi:MAG: hypothetical protein AB7Q17_01925 [Phycisphaerae bacterium]
MNATQPQPRAPDSPARRRATLLAVGLVAAVAGCAARQPDLFPVAPLRVATRDDGSIERFYDLDTDGRGDFCEQLGPDGLVHALRFDRDRDGTLDELATIRDAPPASATPDHIAATPENIAVPTGASARITAYPSADWPQLLLIIDSVPFDIVSELWQQGRLRHFAPPSRIISPFPVMTDVALADFFGVGPCPGVESEYFDGNRLRHGLASYGATQTAPWLACVDYALPAGKHVFAYLNSQQWIRTELTLIQTRFALASQQPGARCFSAYLVTGSAIGSRHGRNGHIEALTLLDRWTQMLMYQHAGRLRITLMSDHGHDIRDSRWVSIPDALRALGYRPVEALAGPTDVVIPTFGQVSCAAVYTRAPAVVAHDLVGVEGVELACYRDGAAVVVLSRDGRARITRSTDTYRYSAIAGDPLRLLSRSGSSDFHCVEVPRDDVAASAADTYPDALHRLWRAFDGLVVHTPDVLVALATGYHTGSEQMSRLIRMRAAHGNLTRESSTGFVMTTAGELPPIMRMQDVAAALRARNIQTPRAERRLEAIDR